MLGGTDNRGEQIRELADDRPNYFKPPFNLTECK